MTTHPKGSPPSEQLPKSQGTLTQIHKQSFSHSNHQQSGRLRTPFPHISRGQRHRRRVPSLLQMNSIECGISCLAMILCYYGYETRISDIRKKWSVGRDGLSLLELTLAARSYGLQTRAISLPQHSLSSLVSLPLPAIIYWEENHFLVLERWSPRGIVVLDPALGRRKLSIEEFAVGFSRVVLLLTPGATFSRRRPPFFAAPLFIYLKRSLCIFPGAFLQIVFTTLLLQCLGLAVPLVTKIVVDQIIPQKALNLLTLLSFGLLVLLVTQAFLIFVREWLLTSLQYRLDMQLLPHFLQHLLTLPLDFFMHRPGGDTLTRLSSNTTLRSLVNGNLVTMLLDSSLVVIYFSILLTQFWSFGLLTLFIGLLQIGLLLTISPKIRALSRLYIHNQGKKLSYETELISGIATIKAAGAEELSLQHWKDLFTKQQRIILLQNRWYTLKSTLLSTLFLLEELSLLCFGAYQVLNGKMGVGTMLALSTLSIAALDPLISFVHNTQQFQDATIHIERIDDVLSTPPEQDITQVQQPPELSGNISLEHVSFRFTATGPTIVSDISLQIKAGQKVAIVGKTGSGKSTLGKLLLGLYLPTKGHIYYDDLPLEQLNYRAVRAQCGVVTQDASIFSGSILDNIRFSFPLATQEMVEAAAQLAELHTDILAMPMRYHTFVAEEGSGLSGGQRQRLALARALLHQPIILLLDEATSALDIETEQKIEHRLNMMSCTQIIIAHRLSTVRHADMIIVMEEGRIAEQGTHDQLLLRDGIYARWIQQSTDH